MDVDTIIGWIIGAAVYIVAEVFAFALSVTDRVIGWGGLAAGIVTFLVVSVVVAFACLVFWHGGLYLLRSMGLWLAWRYVLAAGAVTDWIIARIEARRWSREGANSEWTGDWRTGEAYARGWTIEEEPDTGEWERPRIEDEMLGEQIAEEAREHAHHLMRALRASREWEMLNSATSGKTRSKVAYKRLAQRFHPDRAKPEDKEAATWCMQEINRIWDELPEM